MGICVVASAEKVLNGYRGVLNKMRKTMIQLPTIIFYIDIELGQTTTITTPSIIEFT